jgi:hypothetical protein
VVHQYGCGQGSLRAGDPRRTPISPARHTQIIYGQQRPLTGTRHVASVLDARMRRIVDPLVPPPDKPWNDRLREFGDGEGRIAAKVRTPAAWAMGSASGG